MRGNDGPQLLPTLVRGQQVQRGPYTVTVTDQMVRDVERENARRQRQWEERRRRREMHDDQFYGEFKEFNVRRRFIRRVFFILFLQLMFTVGVCATFLFVPEVNLFARSHLELCILASFVYLSTFIAVMCSDCSRSAPCNVICLVILTSSMSYTVAFLCLFYKLDWILIAAGITSFITVSIWAVATCTKFDLTQETGAMMIISLVGLSALTLMLVTSFFVKIPYKNIITGLIGSFLMSMYLFYDVQTIMGGRTVQLDPDEVIYGAIQLYVDIITIFKYIVMMADMEVSK